MRQNVLGAIKIIKERPNDFQEFVQFFFGKIGGLYSFYFFIYFSFRTFLAALRSIYGLDPSPNTCSVPERKLCRSEQRSTNTIMSRFLFPWMEFDSNPIPNRAINCYLILAQNVGFALSRLRKYKIWPRNPSDMIFLRGGGTVFCGFLLWIRNPSHRSAKP